jgi:dipeptidyl aminopeptidase/acylaminoacyl peptidase
VIVVVFFAATALAAPKVCIDPGHGGSDPGAVGNGLEEKDLNLATALKMKNWLNLDTQDTGGGYNWKVLMTRTTDTYVSLPARSSLLSLLMGCTVLAGHAQAGQGASAKEKSGEHTAKVKMPPGRPITGKADFLVPRWSPDGRFILLSKGKYRGLYILSLKDRSIRTLSDSPGVGYAAGWCQDGRAIAFTEDDRLQIIDVNGRPMASIRTSYAKDSREVFTRDDTIYFRDNSTGRETKISPGEDKFFLPRLSPDRKKVAYIGLSTGIHIINLDNGRTVSIGLGTDATWAPDSKGIIFTHTRDNGHRIIASDLFYADAMTGELTNLTLTPGRHESHATI